MDELVVIKILCSMVQHKLYQVVFSPCTYDTGADYMRSHRGNQWPIAGRRAYFQRVLSAAKHQQALAKAILCSACIHPVRDESRQLVIDRKGLPPTNCFKCLEEFCRTPTCPVAMNTCGTCSKSSCSSCGEVKQCGEEDCDNFYCRECNLFAFDPCSLCGVSFCQYCAPDIIGCSSLFCKKQVCNHCLEVANAEQGVAEEAGLLEQAETDTPPLFSCNGCWKFFCNDCDQSYSCGDCDSFFCSKCRHIAKECDDCDEPFCCYCSNSKQFCFECSQSRSAKRQKREEAEMEME